MRYRPLFIILLFAAAFVCLTQIATAQIGSRVKITVSSGGGGSVGPRPPRVVATRKVAPTVIRETKTVRVSSLSVTTEPGAVVVLSTKGPRPTKRNLTAGDAGTVVFDDVKAGNYVVTSTKDGFESAEADPVAIAAQRANAIDLDLKPITYRLKIKTNLTAGDIVFAPARELGKNPDGSIRSQPLGNYCVVPIKPNGEADITDLQKGYYDIDIKPAAIEYEVKGLGINLPEDLAQVDGSAVANVLLEKKESTSEFSTVWAATDWELPNGWRLDRGMKVRGEGLAFPRNERYLYFTGFEMVANVKMDSGGGAAFMLRATDLRNYYLLEIGSPKAPWGEIARLSVVQNGTARILNSASTVPFRSTLTSSSGFQVKVRSNPRAPYGFSVWVEDSNTGRENAIGDFQDPNNTFQKGAVGIAGFPKADFDVRIFRVCPGRCP